MKRTLATTIVLGLVVGAAAQDQPLLAGRDVATPKKVDATQPTYPPQARDAGLQGLILLEITLNPEGRPVNIRVLRGIPLLDNAAIEAVRTWRYEPTLVDDLPRRVVLIEAVDFFFSDSDAAQAYAGIAMNRREPSTFRIYAISRLSELPSKRQKMAKKTLQKLLKEPDETVANAAKAALAKLPIDSE